MHDTFFICDKYTRFNLENKTKGGLRNNILRGINRSYGQSLVYKQKLSICKLKWKVEEWGELKVVIKLQVGNRMILKREKMRLKETSYLYN